MDDSDSDSKPRRWFLWVLAAVGAGVLRLADELGAVVDDASGTIDEVGRTWEEIRPGWFGKARWALKSVYGFKLATGQNIERQLSIPPNKFVPIELETGTDVQLRYELRAGPEPQIDVLLFTPSEFDRYIEQEQARYVAAGSRLATTETQVQTRLNAFDTYYLVIDNSPLGDTVPGDKTADIQFQANLDEL